jgi:hypothetical protein
MTIERPMFPPRAEEHCQIILLVIGRKAAGVSPSAAAIRIELEHTAPRVRPPDGISETLKNRNLRDGRKPQWSKAEAAREYWRARLDMESGISTAQRHGIPEGTNHPPHIADDRWTLLANWRLSVAAQLMTPTPDTRAIAWKKAALEGEQWQWTDLTKERIEHAIADDEAFLNTHPVRTKLLKQRGKARMKRRRRSVRKRNRQWIAAHARRLRR